MATAYSGNTTRPHWGGADSDVDIHLEQYDGIRDSRFNYTSQFVALSAQRSVQENTNNYRFDRMGTSEVKGRGVGEDVIAQRVTSDKVNIIVEMMMYIRNPIDYLDDWTAPDNITELGRNNGIAFAKAFDEAHIIQLQKARDWVAPTHLKPAFHDGISVDVTVKGGTSLTTQELEQNAEAMYVAIGRIVTEMTKRDVPLDDMVCLITPDRFEALINHPKLLNKDYTEGNGDFAGRRVVQVQGLYVMQSNCFPQEAKTNHILSTPTNGNAFDTTAEDVKGEIIVFSKSLSLITVTAKPFESRFWDDKENMTNVLDCYSMYTVGVRRPDTVGVVLVTEDTTTP
ncbi:capsid protein [Vibrio phage vB_VhaP_VH-5]|uniref:Capsid protein n=1 Tax=Vibrio phage vB_VhaP_VH-5 TaxID=2660694 RepID=A0A5Q2WA29_9CAUD|nr:capsid protein [Vibrio phage vB_VhaP_VH-5]